MSPFDKAWNVLKAPPEMLVSPENFEQFGANLRLPNMDDILVNDPAVNVTGTNPVRQGEWDENMGVWPNYLSMETEPKMEQNTINALRNAGFIVPVEIIRDEEGNPTGRYKYGIRTASRKARRDDPRGQGDFMAESQRKWGPGGGWLPAHRRVPIPPYKEADESQLDRIVAGGSAALNEHLDQKRLAEAEEQKRLAEAEEEEQKKTYERRRQIYEQQPHVIERRRKKAEEREAVQQEKAKSLAERMRRKRRLGTVRGGPRRR